MRRLGVALVILVVIGGLIGLAFADAPEWAWVVASLVAIVAATLAFVRSEARGVRQP